MAIARSRREHLQRIIGERGTIAAFVAIPDLTHRAIGWYVTPHEEIDGCDCEFCAGARAGETIFIATGAFLAATLLHTYAIEHPMRERSASA